MQSVVDWSARMREMMDFVGLEPADISLVRDSAPLLAPHVDGLTTAIYDHFLKFPPARRFFLTEAGEVDQERLSRRKHSLVRWFRATVDFKVDEDFPVFLLATGLVHSHPSTLREHLGPVPSRYMIGTISFAQTAITRVLHQEMDDPHQAMESAVAWSKLLMVQLDVLMAGYLAEPPDAHRGGAGALRRRKI